MVIIDENGRLFGRLNVVDLFMVLFVCAVVSAAYVALTSPFRTASPYALESNREWVRVDLRIPAGEAWLAETIEAGQTQIDPRSGASVAEVLGVVTGEDGKAQIVQLKILAVRDSSARLLYNDQLLVPGQPLRIATESNVIEGLVYRVQGGS